mgnify:CR=1 FL=1
MKTNIATLGYSGFCTLLSEVVLVAVLTYSSIHDINEKNGERLSELFDCCCCGKCVSDDKIEYLWFEQREFTLTEKGNIK